MELSELDATLACVNNPVGGPRIGNARWLGVPVADLLQRAGLGSGAEQLVAHSVDGFSAGVPVERITVGQHALVALGLNGEPLPVANGFPARLLVPGLWGADANTKWLDSLELTMWSAVRDYWDARGWPRRPTPVRSGSRIDVPARHSHLAAGSDHRRRRRVGASGRSGGRRDLGRPPPVGARPGRRRAGPHRLAAMALPLARDSRCPPAMPRASLRPARFSRPAGRFGRAGGAASSASG